MAARRKTLQQANSTAAIVGFGQRLLAAADAMCNNTLAAKDKHLVPSLIFPKYISDTFNSEHLGLDAEAADPEPETSRC
jgi:hypothetical protein